MIPSMQRTAKSLRTETNNILRKFSSHSNRFTVQMDCFYFIFGCIFCVPCAYCAYCAYQCDYKIFTFIVQCQYLSTNKCTCSTIALCMATVYERQATIFQNPNSFFFLFTILRNLFGIHWPSAYAFFLP